MMCMENYKIKIAIAILINAVKTDLHIVSRLRICGAIPLLLLQAFMVWTGKPLPSPCVNLVLDNYVFQTNLPQDNLIKAKGHVAEEINSCLFYSLIVCCWNFVMYSFESFVVKDEIFQECKLEVHYI